MRSINDALREREVQMEKLKTEITALREAARILEQHEERPTPINGDAAKRWP